MARTWRAVAAGPGILALLVLLSPGYGVSARGQAAPQPERLPIVRLLATGGTVSMRPGTRLSAAELVAMLPDLGRSIAAESEQFANVDSIALTPSEWLRLAQRINALFASRPDLSGIVVTMGTDTLEEVAYFLHLTVRDPRPVVVVGAMRPPGSLGFDGAANLMAGFRVAADAGARDLGTLVVLNDEINSAREVAKTDVRRLDAFDARRYGLLGVVDADRVVWHRRPVRRRGPSGEFDVSSLLVLPRVDVVLAYADAPGTLARAAIDDGARGLVVAAAAYSLGPQLLQGLSYAVAKGAPVVVASRTGWGRIAFDDTDARRERFVAADDLAPLKARVLLMLALTRTADRDELQRIFREY